MLADQPERVALRPFGSSEIVWQRGRDPVVPFQELLVVQQLAQGAVIMPLLPLITTTHFPVANCLARGGCVWAAP